MADTKLTALTETSVPALADTLYTVDVSDTTDDAAGSSRQLTFTRMLGLLNHVCQGRLTLTSGTPVTTSDVTGATNVYFTPYNGNLISLYDGTRWRLYTFSELTLALGTLTSGLPYDVFVYDNAGTLTLEATAWTNGTTRATALVLQDGVYVKSGATTRRYLGTFYTTSTTTTEDSVTKRFLWNMYNRVERKLLVQESTASWTYTTATWRQVNASYSNQIAVIIGSAIDPITLTAVGHSYNGTGGAAESRATGIGINSTSANSAGITAEASNVQAQAVRMASTAYLRSIPSVGYSYYAWLEWSRATGTTNWAGVLNSTTDQIQTGMNGVVLA